MIAMTLALPKLMKVTSVTRPHGPAAQPCNRSSLDVSSIVLPNNLILASLGERRRVIHAQLTHLTTHY